MTLDAMQIPSRQKRAATMHDFTYRSARSGSLRAGLGITLLATVAKDAE